VFWVILETATTTTRDNHSMNVDRSHHQPKEKGGGDVLSIINYNTRFKGMYNNDNDDDDDDEDVVVARREATQTIQAAMMMLPFHEKEAYLEASVLAPRLVATESDPLLFLR
jgi:hypothetical protein